MSDPGPGPDDPFGQPPGQPYGGAPYGSMPAGQPYGSPPQNYLVWAILSTVFCCLPLGIVSIVYAAQVNSKWAAGDVAGATDASARAKRFAIIGAAVGLVVLVLYVIAGLAFGFFAVHTAGGIPGPGVGVG
ncbi:MAG: CD225/dispanin family protein [Actinomycetes bacterium]